jgi:hypothetical protein
MNNTTCSRRRNSPGTTTQRPDLMNCCSNANHRKSASDVMSIHAEVPKPRRRHSTLPSSGDLFRPFEISRSSSDDTCESSTSTTRSVNLFDLIDEEFVVNSSALHVAPSTSPLRPPHRRKRSILDMIDGIEIGEGSSLFMTDSSYPRGVYVVPSTATDSNDNKSSMGNVGFVAAEAFNLWR